MSANLLLIVTIVLVSLRAANQPVLREKLLMHPYSISHKKQYGRFVTSGFVHADYVHLFFNVFTLYFFGDVVERIFQILLGDTLMGSAVYILFFLLGVVISDLPTYFKYQNAPYYRSLGASGGVSAVVFASILFNPLADICLYAILCIPGFILGVFYLIYSYHQSRNSADQINHSAHLYGALFGLLFAVVLEPGVLGHFVRQVSTWSPF